MLARLGLTEEISSRVGSSLASLRCCNQRKELVAQQAQRIKNKSWVVESEEARGELGQVMKEELGWGSLKKRSGKG